MSNASLILGAWAGTTIGIPKIFVESARRAVSNTKIVLFHARITAEAYDFLSGSGVELIEFRHRRWRDGPVHTHRFALFADYASRHQTQFDYIMVSDCRDVVFQSDPFARMRSCDIHYFLEPGSETLASNPHYAKWMRRFVGRREVALCANRIPTCCGVVIGGAKQMAEYLRHMARHIADVGFLDRRKIGADSAFHNLMCYVTREASGHTVADDDILATIRAGDRHYDVDDTGTVATRDGRIPSVCHQYDRDATIAAAIQQRYRTATSENRTPAYARANHNNSRPGRM